MAAKHGLRLWVAVASTAVVVLPLGYFWQASLIPDTYDLATMGYADWGGGPHGEHGPSEQSPGGTPVAELLADPGAPADVETTLAVRQDSGHYTVNGSSPGPLLEATVGDLLQITLFNENIDEGATLHWHGVDVPNAADGVAGVTQDAVRAGEKFVYRFVVDQAGTFWYHSHQISHEQVRRGLLGALVVHPVTRNTDVIEHLALLHDYDGGPTLNGQEGVTAIDAEPGQHVRIRIVNTDNGLSKVWVTGAAYQVLAVDGASLTQPDLVEGKAVGVPAGGRVDLGLVVPLKGVRIDFGGTTTMVLGQDPTDGEQTIAPDDFVDLLSYGEPADLGFDPTHPDRSFEFRIGKRPGFVDGRPGMWWTINGHMSPDVPMFMVSEGDVVVFRIENTSDDAHPMHLHGHHAVVISRDGVPATGTPWWVDSLEVRTGETYEIAFVADNPGLWMDHCHNLPHAAEGLVAHLMYDGVRSSYEIGGETDNEPE